MDKYVKLNNDYLKTMENYSPNPIGTGQIAEKDEIIKVDDIPKVTTVNAEETNKVDDVDIIKYMAPKTIQVTRYALKK